jgi:hypothetical protein
VNTSIEWSVSRICSGLPHFAVVDIQLEGTLFSKTIAEHRLRLNAVDPVHDAGPIDFALAV